LDLKLLHLVATVIDACVALLHGSAVRTH
jgi:hypothetical protein